MAVVVGHHVVGGAVHAEDRDSAIGDDGGVEDPAPAVEELLYPGGYPRGDTRALYAPQGIGVHLCRHLVGGMPESR